MFRVLPAERMRFAALSALLFIHSLVLESSEVVATSGFVNRVGASQLLWLWAADAFITILFSSVYSLLIDRLPRRRLAFGLFAGFGAVYAAIFLLFVLSAPDWLCYTLLTVANNQQWRLAPLLIYALANDLFAICEARRLFPLLGTVGLIGEIAGNGLGASAGYWLGGVSLLLGNALLTLLGAAIVALALRKFTISIRQSQASQKTPDALRAGLVFIRDVPLCHYLAPAMVVAGLGLMTLEYHLLDNAARAYQDEHAMETFYGCFKIGLTVLLLAVRSWFGGWVIKRLGFKSVFVVMPSVLLAGFLAAIAWPGLTGVVIGMVVVRLTLDGIDEPSRQAFLGLVPEELRGRVGAVIDGYLQTAGCLLACGLLGAMLLGIGAGLFGVTTGQTLCCLICWLCAGLALRATLRFRAQYVTSLLNWRLQRRRRRFVPPQLLDSPGFS